MADQRLSQAELTVELAMTVVSEAARGLSQRPETLIQHNVAINWIVAQDAA
jgi:hypothetical protein